MLKQRTGGATQVIQKPREKKECCNCGFDAILGTCCDTNRCGCRKNGKACGSDCSCAKPVCKCIERVAVLREVKKDGPNKGRYFWCCSKSMNDESKCDFFCWQSNNSAHTIGTVGDNSSGSSGSSSTVVAPWNCSACTFENSSLATVCVMCGTAKAVSSNNSGGKEVVYCSPCSNTFGMSTAARPVPPKPKAPTKKPRASAAGGGRKRKRCERGASCPYKNEYQHSLEFHHDDEPSHEGAGNQGSRKRSGGSSSTGGSFVPFSGPGNKLC